LTTGDLRCLTAGIHLVRHGQSTWNAVRRIQGQTAHVPLTALGHQQARQVATRLAGCGARAVFSSDLRRAVQTAVPVAERLGLLVTLEPDLRERSLGDLEGQQSGRVWATAQNAFSIAGKCESVTWFSSRRSPRCLRCPRVG
jgi:broad specificity phosphatase PhoE